VLQARLSELRQAGFVELVLSGYCLTDMGRELHGTFLPLHRFAERWRLQRRPGERRDP
jgi:DNA-binding HxlR family transcriptional regulator